MTRREMAENDKLAQAAGFEVINANGRREQRAYCKGSLRVWQAHDKGTPAGWQSAILMDGRYREHVTKPSLQEALARGTGMNGDGPRIPI